MSARAPSLLNRLLPFLGQQDAGLENTLPALTGQEALDQAKLLNPDRPGLMVPTDEVTPFLWQPGPCTVLDIGSINITCLIGHPREDGTLTVSGWGWQRSEGISCGNVVDTGRAETVIRRAVGDAERRAGRRISSLYVNLSAGEPRSMRLGAEAWLSGREVTPADLRALMLQARARLQGEGRYAAQCLPLFFELDGMDGIKNPLGQRCNHIRGWFLTVDSSAGALATLGDILHRAELMPKGLVVSPLASGLSVLSAEERERGVTVVDMGAGTTSLAVFHRNRVVHTAQVKLGGYNITRDIATRFSLPLDVAEWLKTYHGSVAPGAEAGGPGIVLPPAPGRLQSRLSPAALAATISPRLEETLELARSHLDGAGLGEAARSNIVLTGGGSLMDGAALLAARLFNRRVRTGRPRSIHNLPEGAPLSAIFSTAAGLLAWGCGASTQYGQGDSREKSSNFLQRLVERFRGPL
ncbi:cell division protein FtsA [Formicincola oecophyllae]|uniref:Cell division protein FtsA n=1 Tax=Formicincola oecophyllae TaxID=2558361 RepID=A0A4Y6U6M6_9PROT|nr:cell division protein FtsA [Formicincola oecophyllae]QDH13013.1 cell division protein FtsA [Formicincola oecophyllae]